MKKILGALLDIDGTLLDSNGAHLSTWMTALEEQGVNPGHERLRHLIGMGADNLLPALGLREDEGPGKRAKERQKKLFTEVWLPKVKPLPGARALVSRMRDEGIARIVVSSSSKAQLPRLLKAATVDDLMEGSAAGDDAPATKPAPDLVEAGIQRSGLPASSLLMLGDTPHDVTAADRAGVATVALRSGGYSDHDLKGAIAIYNDPEDLLRHFDRSPFHG